MIAPFAISLALIGLSGVLIDMHRRSWHAACHDDRLSPRDRRFARSQYRRRMQASATIGVVGAAIAVGPLVPQTLGWAALYLATLVGACACIMLLALLDAVATQQYFRRLRSEQLVTQIKKLRELHAAGEPSDDEGHAGQQPSRK